MNARPFRHVPRTALHVLCGSLVALMGLPKLYSQELPKHRWSWLPSSFTTEASADAKWAFGREVGIDEIRLWSSVSFPNNLNLDAVVKSRVGTDAGLNDWGKRDNRLAELFFQYYRRFSILPYGLQFRAKAGKVEWYPIFTDLEQIIENMDLYLHPKSMYGANLTLDAPLVPKGLSQCACGFQFWGLEFCQAHAGLQQRFSSVHTNAIHKRPRAQCASRKDRRNEAHCE